MRIFTGLAIPFDVRGAVANVLEELHSTAALRWSPVENLHITSKFIGEWPESRLAELETVLAEMESTGPFAVTVGRFGFLPNPHRPKIFFAGVRGEPGLALLAQRTDLALATLGVKREARSYTPHLTLARIGGEDIGSLRERIAAAPAPEFGSFTAVEYHLYLSRQGQGGSAYSIIGSYRL